MHLGDAMIDRPYIINGKRASKDEYNRAKFDRFLVTVPRGQKEAIQYHADQQGKSLNKYITDLIEKDMNKDRP